MLFSEPKIPQSFGLPYERLIAQSFSALQRAENSSIVLALALDGDAAGFQCSSASRKFLNRELTQRPGENNDGVSVLFSEPKIPQSQKQTGDVTHHPRVSVLFSEPKIPQFAD